MKYLKYGIIAVMAVSLLSCGDDSDKDKGIMPPTPEQPGNETPPGQEPIATSRDEQYRPQIHFTPASNWMNDPNGMVYVDGLWHLYYQYNPAGNGWGNMSWGHAVSRDLMHWEEKPVAMMRNQWGDIFSGSAIWDKDNVAGFGAGAILAFYTASGDHQQQCLAYSTDGGLTFTQYSGNPIIPNVSLADFRDPKVFRHEESGKWIMCLARGWSYEIEFWGSDNLKNWSKLSSFSTDKVGSNKGQWECPDLIKLPYEGGEKWVLIVSNNPGGPVAGSGTEYFVGNFDGTTFVADERDYPLWLDYGADNYAGVTWSGAPDGRKLFIGWMNNWNYAGDVPCNPWRSAMTLPRELTLVNIEGNPVLSTKVAKELDAIAGEWKKADNGICSGGAAYEIRLKIGLNESKSFKIGNGEGEFMEVQLSPSAKRIMVKRNSSTGNVGFNNLFSLPSISAPFNCKGDEMELHVYIDRSSVEILNEEGTMSLTNLVFPSVPYDRVTGIEGVEFRAIKSIW